MAIAAALCDHIQVMSESDDRTHDPVESEEKAFRGWRLLGVIMCVVVVLAAVSFVVDWMVIGPLEGRVF